MRRGFRFRNRTQEEKDFEAQFWKKLAILKKNIEDQWNSFIRGGLCKRYASELDTILYEWGFDSRKQEQIRRKQEQIRNAIYKEMRKELENKSQSNLKKLLQLISHRVCLRFWKQQWNNNGRNIPPYIEDVRIQCLWRYVIANGNDYDENVVILRTVAQLTHKIIGEILDNRNREAISQRWYYLINNSTLLK